MPPAARETFGKSFSGLFKTLYLGFVIFDFKIVQKVRNIFLDIADFLFRNIYFNPLKILSRFSA